MSTLYGNFTWWGFSPALHLVHELDKHEVECNSEEINILIVGAGDGRHTLQTISNLKDTKAKVNFYIIESNLEAIARQVLFISLFIQPLDEYSVQEKSELFLELYGNSLIRHQTNVYLQLKCNDFIDLVTDSNTELSVFSFSYLKFKERDALESIFKFWRSKDLFNISHFWEERLRKSLGVRYDSREGAFDWDYSMNLSDKAKMIRWNEYKKWREDGVAFRKRRDSSYEVPNKTLASGMMVLGNDGEKHPMRGYWGDMIVSPYITFGINSHEKILLEKKNGAYLKSATEISLFNATALIHQLHTGLRYDITEETDDVIIEEINENVENHSIELPNFTLYPLSVNCIHELHKKSKFRSKFDIITVSNSMVHNLDDSIGPLLTRDGLLIVESTMFMIDLKEELHLEYKNKINSMTASAGFKELDNFDPVKHDYAYFKLK